MDDLIDSIVDWGRARNINNPDLQAGKISEELGELWSRFNHGDHDSVLVKDAIGDIIVATTILADILGMDIESCVRTAWWQIKDRKGKTVNGMFIKDNN